MRRVLPFLALLLVLAACGGDDAPEDQRFADDAAPFSFSYPQGLTEVFAPTAETEGSKPLFSVTVGLDDTNTALAAAYDTKVPVDLADAADQQQVDRAAAFLAKETKWKAGERKQAKLGPLTAFVYPIEQSSTGKSGRLVYAFSGTTQYFLRCEWDADGEALIPGACDLVQSSFEPKAAGTPAPASSGGSTGAATTG